MAENREAEFDRLLAEINQAVEEMVDDKRLTPRKDTAERTSVNSSPQTELEQRAGVARYPLEDQGS